MSLAPNFIYDWKILLGFASVILVLVINTQIPILPVSNITFILTSISLWFISLSATFFCLHKLLQKKEPLQLFPKIKKSTESNVKRQIKPKPEKVKALTQDINKYFISKWFLNVSHDQEFTQQSEILLEELIGRLAEVQICVSNKLLLHGGLNLFLRHLKEFRRSLKRKEKYGGHIEELYRYSHMCSNGSKKAKDYFLHQLTTNLLRHFINSELWNSLPCSILVAILSRKLTSYLLKLASHPDILNYLLLNSLASEAVKEKYDLKNYARINITQYFDTVDSSSKKSVEKLEMVVKNVEQNLEDPMIKTTIQAETIIDEIKNSEVKIEDKMTDKIIKEPIRKHSTVSIESSEKKTSAKEKVFCQFIYFKYTTYFIFWIFIILNFE